MPKIVVNAVPLLSSLTGIDRYTLEVVRRIHGIDSALEMVYYYGFFTRHLAHYGKTGLRSMMMSAAKRIAPAIKPVKDLFYRRATKAGTGVGGGFDLYWASDNIPLAAIPSRRTITTIHDFSVFKQPEFHPPERVQFYQKNFMEGVLRSDRLVFVSEFIRAEASAEFKVDTSASVVIPNGVDHDIFRPASPDEVKKVRRRFKLDKKFFLFVGSLNPRKNLRILVKAYLSLPEKIRTEFTLVLAGPDSLASLEMKEAEAKSKGQIKCLGYIPEASLPALYSAARAFAFPSIYEGFGIPPIEAMACGTPVLTAGTSSLPEVCGDAAIYVDPINSDNVADGLLKLATNDSLCADLSRRGLSRASLYSWNSCAASMAKLFNETLTS